MSPLIVASTNASVGMRDGIAVLRDGGSAIHAVLATIRQVEANPDDHSVGFSGLPNLVGEVELDASLMDGRTLATGAVAALQHHQGAIDLARVVMDELPHVLIAGAGAARLAAEAGFRRQDLLTPEAQSIWNSRLDQHVEDDPYQVKMRQLAGSLSRDPERPHDAHGTVNVIARDSAGNIASGVSTSGWAWKYPGRVGDSPIIGAGNYADNRWGAATCTGRGEMAQRCCTAHSVVTFMRCGHSLDAALQRAAHDLHQLEDPYRGEVNIIGIDRDGRHAGVSTVAGKTYIAISGDMRDFAEYERLFVPAAPETAACCGR
ncbi:MAG: isoaspartyl peptidase/L-asparaginase [Chloroflexia bacterium]|nr:isoaspartyl peptidase/L-asparaginase [Chloroflexia bacterium]